ncbi:hypothetical protein BDV12DRAFT_169711 [Aspergillus spectabilis]
MHVISILVLLALLATVGAAAPTPASGGPTFMARQAPIETRVPLPPGSGGDCGHGGHNRPGFGGHQGDSVELCIHPPRDSSDPLDPLDLTDHALRLPRDANTDVTTSPGSDDVAGAHYSDPVPAAPINTNGPEPVQVNLIEGDIPTEIGVAHAHVAGQERIKTHVPFPPGSGGDYDRVDSEVFVGNCVQHEDCYTGSFCVQNWCTVGSNPGLDLELDDN